MYNYRNSRYKHFKDHKNLFLNIHKYNLTSKMVEMSGFEPLAFRVQGGRSTN